MTNTNRHEVDLVGKPFDRWMLGLNTAASLTTAFALIIGAWFGFRELSALTSQLGLQTEQLKLQRQTLEDEWRQKFFDNQIEIYGEVADVAGKIAALRNETDTPEFTDQRRRFLSLYWGKMCIVEGSDVEKAMILFKRGLDQKVDSTAIEQLALNLVHVCRNETNERYFLTDDERKQRESRFGDNSKILYEMQELTGNGG